MLCTSKESLEHVEIRFRLKKYDFLKKTIIFKFLFDFFPNNEYMFFLNFQIFQFFLKIGFNETYKMFTKTKS